MIQLGGAPSTAAGLGLPSGDVGAKRVRAWADRQRIPPDYWAGLIAYSDRAGLGLTLTQLASAHDRTAGRE